MDYLYYEPRTGVTFTERPERRNVYKIEATDENLEQLKKLRGKIGPKTGVAELVTWLAANEVDESPAPFEDRDWATLREVHDLLKPKLDQHGPNIIRELAKDPKAAAEFLAEVDTLVELTGKLVL